MKKSLFIILMVCLALVGFVSCKNEIEPVQEELIYVSFENGSSRALTATLENFSADEYYWSYEAKKNDGSGLKSGETGWDETGVGAVPVQEDKGLSTIVEEVETPTKVPGFSKGYWNFRLFAYKDESRHQLAYWGEADAVLIDSTHHSVSVTVSPISGGNGYLKVGTITFNPASSISDPTGLVVFNDVVSQYNDTTKEWEPLGPEDYSYDSDKKTYTLDAKQYMFTRTYSYASINVASGSVLVTVYSNLTTTVSGSLSEMTSYAQFDAKQNPDVVNVSAKADGITYNDSTKTSGYELTVSGTEAPKVTANVTKNSVDRIMESIQENAGTESGMNIADTTNTSMLLSLGVDTTATTATSVVYEISMTATVTYTKNPGTAQAETKKTTADVSNVADYVTAEIKMQKGLESVVVTHDGNNMTSGADWAASTETDLTVDNFINYAGSEENPNEYGYYFYVNGATDATLYIKTKSFSPFTVTYVLPPKYVAVSDEVLYETLEGADGAIAKAKEGSTITLLCDVELTEQIVVSKILTIETNGNALKGYSYIKGDFDVSSTQEIPDYTKNFYCNNTGMDSDSKGIIEIKRCEARIGERRYKFITEAFAAVPSDGSETIIVNGEAAIKGNAGITIKSEQTITLDLAGYTVTGFACDPDTSQVFLNRGSFTVMDSRGGGVITNAGLSVDEVGNWWTDPQRNYANNIITNRGKFILESGSIIKGLAGNICYSIDSAADNYVIINGGIVQEEAGGTAIRIVCGFTGGTIAHFEINGGRVKGSYAAVWVQLPDKTGNVGCEFVVNGGILEAEDYAFYDYSWGQLYDNVDYYLNGGTIIGHVYSYGGTIHITGGSWTDSEYAELTTKGDIIVSGGTFNFGEGPYWYRWLNSANFIPSSANYYGEDYDTVDEWEGMGYVLIASEKYPGWYEVYTNNLSEVLDLADGYGIKPDDDNPGFWKVVQTLTGSGEGLEEGEENE